MRKLSETQKLRREGYRTPHVLVVDTDLKRVICASIAGTENYGIQNPWDTPDNE